MFWNNFLKLCADKKTKPTAVAMALKISRGSVTNWKNGVIPQETTMKRIADYFGVTVDELLSDSEPTESASAPSLFYSNFLYLCEHEKKPPEKVAAALDLQPSGLPLYNEIGSPKWF